MAKLDFLNWTELNEGDAGAEIAVNELAARILSTIGFVKSMTTTAQPGSPANYDAYILPSSGLSGSSWTGQEDDIAIFLNGWIFITPLEGARVRVNDTDHHVSNDGTNWSAEDGTQVLADGANIAVDLAKGLTCTVTIDGNRTMDNPTKKHDGRLVTFRIQQDATTGSRLITWASEYTFAGGTAPTLSTGVNDVDVVTFMQTGAEMLHLSTTLDVS